MLFQYILGELGIEAFSLRPKLSVRSFLYFCPFPSPFLALSPLFACAAKHTLGHTPAANALWCI